MTIFKPKAVTELSLKVCQHSINVHCYGFPEINFFHVFSSLVQHKVGLNPTWTFVMVSRTFSDMLGLFQSYFFFLSKAVLRLTLCLPIISWTDRVERIRLFSRSLKSLQSPLGVSII